MHQEAGGECKSEEDHATLQQAELICARFSWPRSIVMRQEKVVVEGVYAPVLVFDLGQIELTLTLAGFPLVAPRCQVRGPCADQGLGSDASVILASTWDESLEAKHRLVEALCCHVVSANRESDIDQHRTTLSYELWWGVVGDKSLGTTARPLTRDPTKARLADWHPLIVESATAAALEPGLGSRICQRSRDKLTSLSVSADEAPTGGDDRGSTTVTIFGLGSVGAAAADVLARSYGISRINLIDDDYVEEHNVGRSVYGVADVGLPKVTAMVRHLLNVNPDLVVRGYRQTVEQDFERCKRLIGKSQLVIAATDSVPAQSLVGSATYAAGVTAIFIGMYERAVGGEIVISCPKANSPCYSCTTQRFSPTNNPLRQLNYGLGLLEAVSALPSDILSVVATGVKIGQAMRIHEAGAPDDNALGQFARDVIGGESFELRMSLYRLFWADCLERAGRGPAPCELSLGCFWFPPSSNEDVCRLRATCDVCGKDRKSLYEITITTVDDIKACVTRLGELKVE